VPGGPYPATGTTSLAPGVTGTGTVVVNKDGTIETFDALGNRSHATLNLSDPEHVTGTAITQLGKINGTQSRYPDGTTSTTVTFKGKLVNGVISGTWFDRFQNGTFNWTVR
jgi:hypothetical protein